MRVIGALQSVADPLNEAKAQHEKAKGLEQVARAVAAAGASDRAAGVATNRQQAAMASESNFRRGRVQVVARVPATKIPLNGSSSPAGASLVV